MDKESWEDDVEETSRAVAGMSVQASEDPIPPLLSATATAFVPKATATEWVPSFAAKTPTPAPAQPAPAPVPTIAPVSASAPVTTPAPAVASPTASPPVEKAPSKAQLSEEKAASSAGTSPSTSGKRNAVKEIPSDMRDHINIVFIGHVDAGKSTLGGQILLLSGQVDERTMEKHKRDAKDQNRESWYLSWALDSSPEERAKGKTVETARAYFDTPEKRFTILDAPGHKGFVPEMIAGASQADVAVLVISARKGEFESGFKAEGATKGGQTCEHALLVKTAGVKKIVVVINKMDDPSVLWSQKRYDQCVDKLTLFLRKTVGFSKNDIFFMPLSGFTGANVKEPVTDIDWYKGPSLLGWLNALPQFDRGDPNAPLRLPVMDKFKDMGTYAMGKVEHGSIKVGQALMVMPVKLQTEVLSIYIDETEATQAGPGENVRVKLKNIEEEQLGVGFVLCHPSSPIKAVRTFDVKMQFIDYPTIILKGFRAVMHVHEAVREVVIKDIAAKLNKKTGKPEVMRPKFIKEKELVVCRMELEEDLCLDEFSVSPQLGRFTLRIKSETIAIGRILKLRG